MNEASSMDSVPGGEMSGEDTPRPADRLIDFWLSTDQETPASDKRGLWAVVIGGALFGLMAGAATGYEYGQSKDASAAVILALIGAFVGAVGAAVIGLPVGLIGERLASWLRLDEAVRRISGGRLDSLVGRVLYGALLGALGSPLVFVPMRALGSGPQGYLAAFGAGVALWAVLGTVGGLVDWLASALRSPSRRGPVIFGFLKLAIGVALSLVALLPGIFMAVVIPELASAFSGSPPGPIAFALAFAAMAVPIFFIGLSGYIYFRSHKYWLVVAILGCLGPIMAACAMFTILGAI